MLNDMKTALKTQWLAALRGGKFKQGRGLLRNENNECCCIGVFCDLVAPNDWKSGVFYGLKGWEFTFMHNGEAHMPKETFLKKFGLHDSEARDLVNMNDHVRLSFKEIADWIEQNV
jgi:hypothetical protein